MRLRRKQALQQDPCRALEQEVRLVDAEMRVNVLLRKAESLRAVVTRRDQENHWQASVNRLFLGGTP